MDKSNEKLLPGFLEDNGLFIRLVGYSETYPNIPDRYFRSYEELTKYLTVSKPNYIWTVDYWRIEIVNFWFSKEEE